MKITPVLLNRYLDDLLNIDKQYFEQMVDKIYLNEPVK